MKIEIEINKEGIGSNVSIRIDDDLPINTVLTLLDDTKSFVLRKANKLLPKTGTVGSKEVYEVLDKYFIKDII